MVVKKRQTSACFAYYLFEQETISDAACIFPGPLPGFVYHSHVFKIGFLPRCNSLGRWFCIGYCFYRYVADGKKKSGKLVLVDRNQYGFNPFVFCQRIIINGLLLYRAIDTGFFWTKRME